jgi:Uma2 family endonuclease
MTIAVEPESPSLMPAPQLLKRFTVEEYHKMLQAGALNDEPPVELLEGWIVYKMGQNPPHDVAVKLVAMMLDRALPPDWHTRVQSSITTGTSEPLPDVAVVVGSVRDYAKAHPGPKQVGLLVEVSDSTLATDQKIKGEIYAKAGIAIYWIVNLQESVVEVYSNPTSGRSPRYGKPRVFGPNDSIPLTIAGKSLAPIPVKELLP